MSEKWRDEYSRLIEETDLARFDALHRVVRSIQSRRFFTSPPQGLRSVTWKRTENGLKQSVNSDHGDIDAFRSALVDVRKLKLEKDDTFINKIVNILKQKEDEPERVKLVVEGYAKLKTKRKQAAYHTMPEGIVPNITELERGRTNEELLNALLYQDFVHQGGPDGKPPPPNISLEKFNESDITQAYQLNVVQSLMFAEAHFAVWLSSFIKTKGNPSHALNQKTE